MDRVDRLGSPLEVERLWNLSLECCPLCELVMLRTSPYESKRGRSIEPCEGLTGWGMGWVQPLTFLHHLTTFLGSEDTRHLSLKRSLLMAINKSCLSITSLLAG
ncbi:hypothetical protein AVEN_162992-1 [Araneus ventricosus]|uniref:Uncharacterized protein n=1 Tax=Araneus ventricosus TaxID=182803 RepID=A0A4Y2BZ70_ARAVE|nr:hypothetical protein AVEN_162992-1 [Araneus ventricosus]